MGRCNSYLTKIYYVNIMINFMYDSQENVFVYSEIQLKKSARNIQVFNFNKMTDINVIYSRFNMSNKIYENTNTPSQA